MPQNPKTVNSVVPDCFSISITEFADQKTIAFQYKYKATDENSENGIIQYNTLTPAQKSMYDNFVNMVDSLNK